MSLHIKQRFMKRLCLRFLSLFLLLGIYGSLRAQDFEVAPVKLSFSVEPGHIDSKILTVRNYANVKQAFTITLGDIAKDSLGNKKIPPKGYKRSCIKWLSVSPTYFDLNPNESKQIKVIMQVPANAYSTKWAMLYVNTTKERTSINADKGIAAGLMISPRIGVFVIQSPKSNHNYRATITSFTETTTAKDSLRTYRVKIDNVGDKAIVGKVYLVASNLQTAQEKKVPAVIAKLLPGESQVVKLKLPANFLSAGKYSLAAILDYGHNTALEAAQMTIDVK